MKSNTDTKYFTLNEIMEVFSKKKDKISILWDALDYMQQYNGRDKWYCVARVLGYDNEEGRNDTFYKN